MYLGLDKISLSLDYTTVTVYREHDASKRQPAAFPGNVITVPPHTKKDNPKELPSSHPQPQ